MSDDDLVGFVEENLKPSPSKRLREVIGDAFTFINSQELNKAIAAVTLESLMGDQIKRNGDSDRSNAAQYDPYSYNPNKTESAGNEPLKKANFLGGSDTDRPTKLDRLLAITNSLGAVIDEIKKQKPVDVAKPEEYTDIADVAAPESEE